MLKEVRNELRKKLSKYVAENKISVYRGRKEKININGVSFNTVNLLIKKDNYPISNATIIKLLLFFGLEYDLKFFEENNIIKLLEYRQNEQIK